MSCCSEQPRVHLVRMKLTDRLTTDVTVVSPRMGEHGWPFANVDAFPGADVDPLYNSEHVKDIYLKVAPEYDGRYVSMNSTNPSFCVVILSN